MRRSSRSVLAGLISAVVFTGVASADCLVRIEAEFGVRLPADFVDDYDAAALALYASGQLAPIAGIADLLAALRDVTPEATRAVLEREAPGFGEEMRRRSVERFDRAILTRSTAGTVGRCRSTRERRCGMR